MARQASTSTPTSRRRLGRGLSGHLPALLAAGAVGLYGLGILVTLGELRATGVDIARAFTLIPLEEHLRNGIGILVSPSFLAVSGFYIVFYFLVRIGLNPQEGQEERNGGGERVLSRLLTWERRIGPILIGAVLLFGAVSSPWPVLIAILVVVASWFLFAHLRLKLGGGWADRTAELYVLVSVASLVLISALDAYFRSDPLPRGDVVTSHRRVSGPVISADNGLLYLAPSGRGGLYRGVAVDGIDQLTVKAQRREDEPSVLNYIGVDWPQKP